MVKINQNLHLIQLTHIFMQYLKSRVPLKLIVMAVFMPHGEVLIEQPETVRDVTRML